MIDKKAETLQIFEKVMRIVWQRLSPTFGIRTINAIAKNVIVRGAQDHPFLRYLQVDQEGLVWDDMKSHVEEVEEEELNSSLESLVDEFFEALSNLIGKLMVGKLFQEAEEQAKKGEAK